MIVVTDTSVVLNLCCLELEGLLAELFGTVLAPLSVANEFRRLAQADSRFAGLEFPASIRIASALQTAPALAENRKLDQGEIDALSLALELRADAVLIDERAGRHAAADLGLPHIGLLGILIRSKETGLLGEIVPLLDQLQSRAGFWISPALRERIMELVNE